MKLKPILFAFVAVSLLSFTVHKFYFSLTQIKYKPEQKAVQVLINVFMDDIELALNNDYNIDLQLTSKKELQNNDVYFEKYLKEKLQIKINGEKKEYKYLGKEYEADLVLFYIEIENVNSITSLEVTNTILIKHFPTQQNLVKTRIGKKRKTVLLDKDETKSIVNYN